MAGLLLIGAGGHGRSVLEALRRRGSLLQDSLIDGQINSMGSQSLEPKWTYPSSLVTISSSQSA
jgi:hypothetical protein